MSHILSVLEGALTAPDTDSSDELFAASPRRGARSETDVLFADDDPADDTSEDGHEAPGSDDAGTAATGRANRGRKTAASKSPSTPQAAAAISSVLAQLDPDLSDELDTPAEPAPQPRRAAKAGATRVQRPNGETYRARRLGSDTDLATLRRLRELGVYVLLAGYPGCGKTALADAAYAGDDLDGPVMYTIHGHADMEVGDLVGSWLPNPDKKKAADRDYVWVDGPLTRAMKDGAVLFVDDVTLIPPNVLSRMYPAMDGRRAITIPENGGETVTATDGFYVVGAHNPGIVGSNLSEALASRFGVHLTVETDMALARQMGIDDKARKLAVQLRKRREASGGYGWAPEMRELLTFQRLAREFGDEFAAANLVSQAPPDMRDDVAEVVSSYFDVAGPLALD